MKNDSHTFQTEYTHTEIHAYGGEGNCFAGRDITVTHLHMSVPSIACRSLECDKIIPLEKAELRRGLCIKCYRQEENYQHMIVARKNLLPLTIVGAGICFLGLGHMVLDVFSQPQVANANPSRYIEIWIGMGMMIFGLYRTYRAQSRVKAEYALEDT